MAQNAFIKKIFSARSERDRALCQGVIGGEPYAEEICGKLVEKTAPNVRLRRLKRE
jgi:hypothetical protein